MSDQCKTNAYQICSQICEIVRALPVNEEYRTSLLDLVNEAYGVAEDHAADAEYLRNLINKTWPKSEEIMAKFGWVPKE